MAHSCMCYIHLTIKMLHIWMVSMCLQCVDGSYAWVVFVQHAKCSDHRNGKLGYAGSEDAACLKCCQLWLLARWLTSQPGYSIGCAKSVSLRLSACLYVQCYLPLQFCTDYNQTLINMIWVVATETLLSQIFHRWRRIEVNCIYISRCN